MEFILPGLVIVLGIVVIIYIVKNKDNNEKEIYDERQTLETLKAYKFGFFAMLIMTGICIIVSEFTTNLLDIEVWGILILFSGLIVFTTLRVLNDAYFPINKNPKRYLTLNGLIALMNLACFLMNYMAHQSVKTYYINGFVAILNGFVAILFVYLFILILFKVMKDKSED